MTSDALLQVSDLQVHFGRSQILHGVDLAVDKATTGMLGRNGMGKTTLCAAIMGLVPTSGGSIRFAGQDMTRATPEARARLGIGYVPQGRRVFRSLTVEEHLRLMERRSSSWTIERVYNTFPRLQERRRNLGNQLSGGEQQMLAISRALMLDPRLMILDEPTEGLAPAIVSNVIDLIKKIASEGVAVLLVEQNLHAALASTQNVQIMVSGSIVETLATRDLAQNPELQKRHLGIEPGRLPSKGVKT